MRKSSHAGVGRVTEVVKEAWEGRGLAECSWDLAWGITSYVYLSNWYEVRLYTLNSIISHFVATKVHLMLWSFVVLTWMRDL